MGLNLQKGCVSTEGVKGTVALLSLVIFVNVAKESRNSKG